MAHGQGFAGRDDRRLPKPAVPPEFQERMGHGEPQAAWGYADTVASDWAAVSGPAAAPGMSAHRVSAPGPALPQQPAGYGHPGSWRASGAAFSRQSAAAVPKYERAPYQQLPYGQTPTGRRTLRQASFGQPSPGLAPYQGGQPWIAPRQGGHVVRNVLAVAGGAVVASIVIIVGAAVNNAGHTLQSTGAVGGLSSGSSGGTTQQATVGTTITLTGNSSGERMGVTVTKVIDNASPTDSFDAAPAGDRLFTVQFRLSDTGSASYSDAPSNGSVVIDTSGQSYQPGFETVDGCQAFASPENIAPGSSGLGCITFEVPKATKIVSVQFTLDSGMAPDTGQWSVSVPSGKP
jgi:hypothetical protein